MDYILERDHVLLVIDALRVLSKVDTEAAAHVLDPSEHGRLLNKSKRAIDLAERMEKVNSANPPYTNKPFDLRGPA